jgi:hypothetical protein
MACSGQEKKVPLQNNPSTEIKPQIIEPKIDEKGPEQPVTESNEPNKKNDEEAKIKVKVKMECQYEFINKKKANERVHCKVSSLGDLSQLSPGEHPNENCETFLSLICNGETLFSGSPKRERIDGFDYFIGSKHDNIIFVMANSSPKDESYPNIVDSWIRIGNLQAKSKCVLSLVYEDNKKEAHEVGTLTR